VISVEVSLALQKTDFWRWCTCRQRDRRTNGRWQDLESRSLKNILVDLDQDGTGRIPLSEFYRATLDGIVPKPFEFDESVGFLRQFGALDESDALRRKVLIPNYVNARTV